MRCSILGAIPLLVACGPTTGADDGGQEGTAGSGSTTVVGGTTVVGDGSTTASDPGTTSSTPPGTSTTTGDETTTGEPESVCDPQPEQFSAWAMFDFDLRAPDPAGNPHVYIGCVILEPGPEGFDFGLGLSCEDGEHTIVGAVPFTPWIDSTGVYELTVWNTAATFGGGDQMMVLRRDDGQVAFAAGLGPGLPGELGSPADFFAPLGVELLTDVCDPEPLEGQEAGFIDSPCFQTERQALRFSLGGRQVDVYDHAVEPLAPLVFAVEVAETHHEITCRDVSDRWYQWVAVAPLLD